MADLALVDADMFWRSRLQATDQFLLYSFAAQADATAASLAAPRLLDELRRRAHEMESLAVRVAPAPRDLGSPRWVPAPIVPGQFRHHRGPLTWEQCRRAVADSLTDSLDATDQTWRIHLYGPLSGVPRSRGPAWVVVFQVSHALADGRTASGIARELFGGEASVDAPPTGRAPGMTAATLGAAGVGLQLAAAVGLGLQAWRTPHPPEPTDRAAAKARTPAPMRATVFNREPGPDRRIDTITVSAAGLRSSGAAITVAVLLALGDAVADALDSRDRTLAVELTVGRNPGEQDAAPGKRRKALPRNNFWNHSIGLHLDIRNRDDRARAIADDIDAARRRGDSERRRAEARAAEMAPAVLRALAARQMPTIGATSQVAGLAVVSSVNRGPADLTFGGGRVLFTAGFPALSSAHALNVGVHGIGDAVTVSVLSSPSVVPDVDRLVRVLRRELESAAR